MIIGTGELVYEVAEGWGEHFYTPFVEVAGLCSDTHCNLYAFVRGIDPILVLDAAGRVIKSWGRGSFSRPHGFFVDSADSIYCTDDGNHTVRKFASDGRLLMTLGTMNQPSETGCVNRDYRTVRKSAGPFNAPTDVAVDKEKNIYVSDGYANARIHKFSKDGDLILSWGEPGRKPGQFNLPHGICTDQKGIVYVADRENSRIQLFDLEGTYLEQWDANRPTDLFIYDNHLYVTELGYKVGVPLISTKPKDGVCAARLSILTLEGEMLARFWSEKGCSPGSFYAPHSLCLDLDGSLYVGEVAATSDAPPECHTLQKFIRRR